MAKKKMAKKGKARRSARPARSARPTRKAAPKKVSAIPAGYHTVTPYIVCRGAADAMAFYTKAFGAKERVRMPGPDGQVMHAEMRIGDSMIMLGDENPQQGATAPQTVGGTAVHIFLYVPNVDKTFAQATAAGATPELAPTDMFWGDRYCKLSDPYGHKWSLATHIEDVSPKEMGRRMQAAFAQQPPPAAG
jgi:uncharacterized glyoxalase superfamily protein PhnB